MIEDRAVRQLRRQMTLLQRRLRHELSPRHGVSRSSLKVLATVARTPDLSPRDVSDELQMTSSNVAAALRELEAAGFVHRQKDRNDARRVRLSATDAGTTVIAEVRSERDTWLGRAMQAVLDPDELAVLVHAGRLMERLAEFDVRPHRQAEYPPSVRGG